MNSPKRNSGKKSFVAKIRSLVLGFRGFNGLCLSLLLCGSPAQAQAQQPPAQTAYGASAGLQQPDQRMPGSIRGTTVDPSGAAIAGARVRLTRGDQTAGLEVLTAEDGQFSFADIAPGNFQLTITSVGFATQTSSGVLHPGEICIVPQIALTVATSVTEVRVVPPSAELAEVQIKEEEKQRVLGVIPNFYVTYIPNAVPLTPKQKFELAWKTSMDPVSFGLTAAIAGVEQAVNQFSGYGQGAEGYGKRYGAAYADFAIGTFIGSAALPSLFRQDPRYFYKGSGSRRSRLLYALANSVICKGDNGHWQPSYSTILGSIAAGGISNLYYPANDRGAALTFENAAIGVGATAAANILQEFVIRKLTPNAPHPNPANP